MGSRRSSQRPAAGAFLNHDLGIDVLTAKKKPRLYGAIQVPREYRMPILEALDVIAFDMGAQEGAERAPSAEVWRWLLEKLEEKAERVRRPDYFAGLWLQEKRKGATPLDVIAEEIGIA